MARSVKDLEAKIAERANANVQKRIDEFKRDIDTALCKLFKKSYAAYFGEYERHARESVNTEYGVLLKSMHSALSHAMRDTGGWPSLLWDMEQSDIRDELLAKMDLMQQLLTAPPRSAENDAVKGDV